MTISRRKFFKVGALSLLASSALGNRSLAFSAGKPEFLSDDYIAYERLLALRAGDFRNQLNSRFEFAVGVETRRATLIAVENLSIDPLMKNSPDTNCFALKFQLTGLGAGKQATYKVNHPILGEFQLFLVPGELPSKKRLLIAIVNRSQ